MVKICIVVARYNENVSWTKQFPNVIIYNKGQPLSGDFNEVFLDNVGRECHTYYKYIYDNYHNLTDYTIFLQGNPFDHSMNIIHDINKYIDYMNLSTGENTGEDKGEDTGEYTGEDKGEDTGEDRTEYTRENEKLNFDFKFLSDTIYKCNLTGCMHHPKLPLIETYEKIFNEKRENMDFIFGTGSQFIVSKKKILERPREFYLKIVKLINYDINPIEGFVIERFHGLIFS